MQTWAPLHPRWQLRLLCQISCLGLPQEKKESRNSALLFRQIYSPAELCSQLLLQGEVALGRVIRSFSSFTPPLEHEQISAISKTTVIKSCRINLSHNPSLSKLSALLFTSTLSAPICFHWDNYATHGGAFNIWY